MKFLSQHRYERIGEWYLLAGVPLFGLFPIVANYASKLLPPMFFAGVSNIVTGAALLLPLVFAKAPFAKLNGKILAYIFGNTVFNIIIPFILIYSAAQYTSGISTALLLQTELLTSMLICGLFFGEKLDRNVLIGGITILLGTTAVLFNGSFSLNWAEMVLLFTPIFYPFGNQCGKFALEHVSPLVVLFMRSVIGGIFLMMLSVIFENTAGVTGQLLSSHLWLILGNGVFLYGLSKLLWFSGLQRIKITKATAFIISNPGFSLIYAYWLLHEIPSGYQILGLLLVVAGLLVLTKQQPTKTAVME